MGESFTTLADLAVAFALNHLLSPPELNVCMAIYTFSVVLLILQELLHQPLPELKEQLLAESGGVDFDFTCRAAEPQLPLEDG